MKAQAAHREVPVKVTAWVDEGVAPLVVALNEFDRLITLDSCEGADEWGAYVICHFRGTSRQAARFASDLAATLRERDLPYRLQAEWRGEDEPLLVLSCPRAAVTALAEGLSAARTKASDGGTHGKAPRSSRANHHPPPSLRSCDGTQPYAA